MSAPSSGFDVNAGGQPPAAKNREIPFADLPNSLPETLQPYWTDLPACVKSHPIIRDDEGAYRFKANWAITWCQRRTSLNDLWLDAWAATTPIEDLMVLYAHIGYSLCGWWEIFEQYVDDKPEDAPLATAGSPCALTKDRDTDTP